MVLLIFYIMDSFYDLLIYLHQENGAIRFLCQGQFLRSMAKYNSLIIKNSPVVIELLINFVYFFTFFLIAHFTKIFSRSSHNCLIMT